MGNNEKMVEIEVNYFSLQKNTMKPTEHSPSALHQVSFSLLSLPIVVLRQLISGGYLDSESTLFLGATCQTLGNMVAKQISSEAKWLSLLNVVGNLSKDIVQVKIYLVRSLTSLSVCRQQQFY